MKWWVSEINDPEGHILVADRDGLVAAVTIKEDADLISAAPDMLEALEEVRKSFVWQTLNADTRMRVKLAISKAKGESK